MPPAVIQIDWNAIVTTVFSSMMIALIVTGIKSNRILNKIVDQIGTNHPPEGILGRLSRAESELYQVREWAIRHGYDRRHEPEGST
jgi:hypothetical protein